MLFKSLGLTQELDRCFAELKQYNLAAFGGTSGAQLVVSKPCMYRKSDQGWPAIESNGLGRLKRIVHDMGVEPIRGGLEVSAQASQLFLPLECLPY